jgi:hypothetical protein
MFSSTLENDLAYYAGVVVVYSAVVGLGPIKNRHDKISAKNGDAPGPENDGVLVVVGERVGGNAPHNVLESATHMHIYVKIYVYT